MNEASLVSSHHAWRTDSGLLLAGTEKEHVTTALRIQAQEWYCYPAVLEMFTALLQVTGSVTRSSSPFGFTASSRRLLCNNLQDPFLAYRGIVQAGIIVNGWKWGYFTSPSSASSYYKEVWHLHFFCKFSLVIIRALVPHVNYFVCHALRVWNQRLVPLTCFLLSLSKNALLLFSLW